LNLQKYRKAGIAQRNSLHMQLLKDSRCWF